MEVNITFGLSKSVRPLTDQQDKTSNMKLEKLDSSKNINNIKTNYTT